jgi:hypothetical protein
VELCLTKEVAASFDPRRTSTLGKVASGLGALPLAHLTEPGAQSLTYGYIGTDDTTMYPLLRPGSLLQIDSTIDTVSSGPWRSEYERPIYFFATRTEYICSWCTLVGDNLVLQPHPLSSLPVRVLRYPQEVDLVGEVIGVAMKLRPQTQVA